jgi:hypothetical protein
VRWYRAAVFSRLPDAGKALHCLESAFFGRPEFIGWQFVTPGLEDGDNYLIVAALARDEFDVVSVVARRVAVALGQGGIFIDLPPGLVDLLFKAWNQAVIAPRIREPNLTFMSTLECRTPKFLTPEGVLVVTSHAKCRECGDTRHKIARFNLCQACWEKVKPSIRREWREIKDRRRLRQAVEAHIEQTHQDREQQNQLVTLRQLRNSEKPVGTMTPAEAQLAIEKMRLEGVPPPGTPARGFYMTLHAIVKGRTIRHIGDAKPPTRHGDLDETDRLVGRLYAETTVPVGVIFDVMKIDSNRMRRIQRTFNIPNRESMPRDRQLFRPHRGEELALRDGIAVYVDTRTGDEREVFAEETEQPELELEPVVGAVATLAEPAPEPPPMSAEWGTRRGHMAQVNGKWQWVADETPADLVTEVVEMVEQATPVAETAEQPAGTRRRGNGKPKRFDEATRREIARLYDDVNIPLGEIRDAYGISDATIDRVRREFDISGRVGRPGYKRPGRPRVQSLVEAKVAEPRESGPEVPQPEPVTVPQPVQQWMAQATAALEADAAAERQNGHAEVVHPLAVPTPGAPQHAWFVRFVVTHESVVGAVSIDQALAQVRHEHGEDVEILHVQRT